MGYTTAKGNFRNVSLGQGQEIVAEETILEAAKKGDWVILQVNSSSRLRNYKLYYVDGVNFATL